MVCATYRETLISIYGSLLISGCFFRRWVDR